MTAAAIVTVGTHFAVTYFKDRSGPSDEAHLMPDNPEWVAKGKVIYGEHCASCHGVLLEGQPNWREPNADGRFPAPPHNATGHTWHHPDWMLIDLTRWGAEKALGIKNDTDMPAFEGVLSPTEIAQALSFIKSTWPDEVKKRHDEINARGPRPKSSQ